ncbi:MAG: GAF sensor protein, partial [Nitrospina sp.]|nr:GAF sensor protein [Nitrospina sp.]
EACRSESPEGSDDRKQTVSHIDSILKILEAGEGDFWSQVHKPFKENIITKGTVKNLIQTARNRYQANLPGLAIKLGVCTRDYQSNSEELKKFTSFKNFLYKTIKISDSN